MAMTFERSDYNLNRYKVFDGDRFLGFVERVEGWTVRGRPISWKARRIGHAHVGSASTRKEAAQLLAK